MSAVTLDIRLDAVFGAQLVRRPWRRRSAGELHRLPEDHAAVFGVGVVAETAPSSDEALTLGIDHDSKG